MFRAGKRGTSRTKTLEIRLMRWENRDISVEVFDFAVRSCNVISASLHTGLHSCSCLYLSSLLHILLTFVLQSILQILPQHWYEAYIDRQRINNAGICGIVSVVFNILVSRPLYPAQFFWVFAIFVVSAHFRAFFLHSICALIWITSNSLLVE